MASKIYWLHQFENGARIGIAARPRGGEWLKDEILYLHKNKVNVLFSLLEHNEIYELELELEEQECTLQNMKYINFPIADREVPEKNLKTDNFIDSLVNEINNGLSIIIHCRMGIGRSSIIAAAVLLKFNFDAKNIFKIISNARGLNVPDTDEQIQWVLARGK